MICIWDNAIHILSLKPIATCSGIMFWVLMASLLLPPVRKLFLTNVLQTSLSSGDLGGFDALRGVAAMYVLIAHCLYFPSPIFADAQFFIAPIAFAIPIFAVLCGYLIYRSLAQMEFTTSNLQKYLLRRFFRVYPLYVFSVAMYCFFSTTYFRLVGWGPLTFITSDLFMTRILWAPTFGNPVVWNLFPEILFYLLAPLLLLIPKDKILATAITAFFILTIADQVPDPREYFLWKYFFAGIIAYELPRKFPSIKSPFLSYMLVILGVFVMLVDLSGQTFDFFHRLGLVPKNPRGYTLGMALSIGLIMTGLPQAPRISTFLNLTPFRLMALISYSIFLLHPFYLILNFPELSAPRLGLDLPLHEIFKLQEPLPNWYFFGIFIPGFLPWAFASYLLIERPFLNMGKNIIKKRWALPAPIPVLKAA